MRTILKPVRRRTLVRAAIMVVLSASVTIPTAARAQSPVTLEEARAITKDAYIYGFPMVDSYRIEYAYFVDATNPQFKAPWNQLSNVARVFTPADTAIQTPNSDTPYSFVGMDLRAEPLVLTIPEISKERYFSVQLIDAYTHNFDYIGSRTTGNGGGTFLVAGPRWRGTPPPGITKVIRSETDFVMAGYRTQLFNPSDLENVKQIQASYKAQTLSEFLGQPKPAAAPISFIKPLTPDEQKTSPEFFNVLNFVLGFGPTHPSERDLMVRFSKIGVGPGKTFDLSRFSPEVQGAIKQGMADAWTELATLKAEKIDKGLVTAGDLLGPRELFKGNYLYRMAGAVLGIYGNSKAEAMYPLLSVDSEGKPLAGTNRYTVKFPPAQLPPVNAFWSLTMYELPKSLLVDNPLNRYLINSPMLPQLAKDADGGLTLYIQNESPGKDKESNWLPAPNGPFLMFMRLYWPKPEALDGTWKPPAVVRAD